MQVVVRSELLASAGFAHGFSLRYGGVSRAPYESLNLGRSVGDDPQSVADNHRRLAQAVGYAPERLFELGQVHGRRVRAVAAAELPDAVRAESGDALCAHQAGVVVGIRSADCLPLLLADPETRAVAAVHAGWRGTVAGVVPAAVDALRTLSQAPSTRLLAALFPHIRSCCFEVGEEVAQQLSAASRAQDVVLRSQRPKPHAELSRVVHAQLLAAGIEPARVDDVPGCTCCEAARFFSYRRDGQASGRHLAVIAAG